MAKLNKIDDEGVSFQSPRDGKHIYLTPEKAIEIQMALGADVAMAFDQCPLTQQANQTLRRLAREPIIGWRDV